MGRVCDNECLPAITGSFKVTIGKYNGHDNADATMRYAILTIMAFAVTIKTRDLLVAKRNECSRYEILVKLVLTLKVTQDS